MNKSWYLYVVLCRDGTLYTGITTDVERRVAEHNAGKGAKYTRGRRPVVLVRKRVHKNRSAAAKAESRFKKLSVDEKWEKIMPSSGRLINRADLMG